MSLSDATPTEQDQLDSNDDDFTAGFDGADAPTATPETKPAETAAATPDATPVVTQAPKYVQITQEQFDGLMSSAAKIDEIKATQHSQLDKAFGKIGGIERL